METFFLEVKYFQIWAEYMEWRDSDQFKTFCLGGSNNLSADALSSDVLFNIQGLMRCQLKTAFSVADMDTANTESCVLGEEASVIKKPISSEKLRWQETPPVLLPLYLRRYL